MPERTLRHSFKAAEIRSAVIISALLAAGTLAAGTLAAGTLAAGTLAAAPVPRADPVRASPASVGIDAEPLAALDADIASSKFPLVDSLLVMRCGEIVFDRRYPHDYATTYGKEAHTKGPLNARLTGRYNYFDPTWHPYFHGTDEHTMQSVSKTVTSAIIGVAMM